MIEVLLVDEEEQVRTGLGGIIAGEPDMRVVGEATAGSQVLGLVRTVRPDVVMMDVPMADVDGIAVIRRLTGELPGPPRVLVLTTFGNDTHVYDALRAGASGFLLKRAPAVEVVRAVRTVAAGDALLFPAAVRELVATRGRGRPDGLRDAGLTEREGKVLRWMARGLSDTEIARELAVGARTVTTDIGEVLAKLGVRERIQAVVAAYESRFLDPDHPDA